MGANPNINVTSRKGFSSGDRKFMNEIANTVGGWSCDAEESKKMEQSHVFLEAKACEKIIFIGGSVVVHNKNAACEDSKPEPGGKPHPGEKPGPWEQPEYGGKPDPCGEEEKKPKKENKPGKAKYCHTYFNGMFE